jgi:hypothetical protein
MMEQEVEAAVAAAVEEAAGKAAAAAAEAAEAAAEAAAAQAEAARAAGEEKEQVHAQQLGAALDANALQEQQGKGKGAAMAVEAPESELSSRESADLMDALVQAKMSLADAHEKLESAQAEHAGEMQEALAKQYETHCVMMEQEVAAAVAVAVNKAPGGGAKAKSPAAAAKSPKGKKWGW